MLRERTIPLVNLAEALGLTRDEANRHAAKIVVVCTSGQIGGLEVDGLGERLDVMPRRWEGFWVVCARSPEPPCWEMGAFWSY